MLLVAAYLVYVFASKEKGKLAELGKALSWTLVVIALLTLILDLSHFAFRRPGQGKFGEFKNRPPFAMEQQKGKPGEQGTPSEKGQKNPASLNNKFDQQNRKL
jgi:hypothetical protein